MTCGHGRAFTFECFLRINFRWFQAFISLPSVLHVQVHSSNV